jgi:hypothetical protein
MDALQILNFTRTYHMRDVLINHDQDHWVKLINIKAQNTRALELDDFEIVFKYVDVIADFPATIFATDILRGYPSAKVIILQRSEEDWLLSMLSTLIPHHRAQQARNNVTDPMAELRQAYHSYCWNNDFSAYGLMYFRGYYAEVDQLVTEQERDILRYTLSDGWEPLCQFLGRDAPSTTFPRSDAWASYRATATESKTQSAD